MKVQNTVVTTTITNTSVVLDNVQDADITIKRFAEVKRIIKALEAEQEMLNDAIRAMLGDNLRGTIGGVVRAELKPRTRTGVEMKDLKEAYPEAYELCAKTTKYFVLDAE